MNRIHFQCFGSWKLTVMIVLLIHCTLLKIKALPEKNWTLMSSLSLSCFFFCCCRCWMSQRFFWTQKWFFIDTFDICERYQNHSKMTSYLQMNYSSWKKNVKQKFDSCGKEKKPKSLLIQSGKSLIGRFFWNIQAKVKVSFLYLL